MTQKNNDSNRVGKTKLVADIAEQTGLTRAQAEGAFNAAIRAILAALHGSKSVGLPELGTLSVKETAARTGVKPGTSEKIQIPAGKKVSFKMASSLKESL